MKILVLGGSGFIGSHLTDNLLKKGHKVTTFDRSTKPISKNGVTQIKGDIMDIKLLEEAAGGHDGVINLVGRLGSTETITSPYESVETNIVSALHFFETVKKQRKPAVQITMGAYMWPNTYSITKFAAERFGIMYNLYQGTKIAVVRAMNVYGEGQKHAPVKKVVPNFILPALKNEPLLIYGNGEQLIDVISVYDTAEILARALLDNHNSYKKVIEAGTGQSITVNELADLIIALTKSRSKKKYIPMRQGEPFRSVTKADPRTLKPLGISPTNFVPLEEGLKQTINWYKKTLINLNRDDV